MLLLKRHLVQLVRSGQKRQTIRLWTRPLLRPGQISYTPGLGKMLITAVDLLPNLQALTHEDALADGFPNLPALLAEIHRIYGPTPPPNRQLYRIQFHWPLDPTNKPLILPKPTEPCLQRRGPAASKFTTRSQKTPPQNRKSKIKNQKSKMSPSQRQSLRSYILSKRPSIP